MGVKQALVSDIPAAELARLCAAFGYGDGKPASIRTTQLFGGYSGVTFRIEETGASGRLAVLKVCKGYPEAEVRAQAAVQGLIGARGFTGGCSALPLAGAPGDYVTLSSKGEPVCMLTHVAGSPADAAIDAGVDPVEVLRAVGEQLAHLHLVPADARADGLRTFVEGGACLLAEHARGAMLREMEQSEHTRAHPFVARYRALLVELRATVGDVGLAGSGAKGGSGSAAGCGGALPTGVIHGDCFLDNVLLVADPPLGKADSAPAALPSSAPAPEQAAKQPARTPVSSVSGAVAGLARSASGSSAASAAGSAGPTAQNTGAPPAAQPPSSGPRVRSVHLVDFEDATVGPLVFDVACCAAGSCFVPAPPAAAIAGAGAGADADGAALAEAEQLGGVLDAGRLAALLLGYCAVRPLTAAEKGTFAAWLRASLTCNASWRFVNFHIKNREAVGARDSYRELEARLRQLEEPDTLAMVHAILNALPQAPEDRAPEPAGAARVGGGASRAPDEADDSSWVGANLPAVAAATAAAGFVLGALLRAGARHKGKR